MIGIDDDRHAAATTAAAATGEALITGMPARWRRRWSGTGHVGASGAKSRRVDVGRANNPTV